MLLLTKRICAAQEKAALRKQNNPACVPKLNHTKTENIWKHRKQGKQKTKNAKLYIHIHKDCNLFCIKHRESTDALPCQLCLQ